MKSALLMVLFCFFQSAIAETYKCIQSGKTIYSTSSCGENAQIVPDHFMTSESLSLNVNYGSNEVQQELAQVGKPLKPVAINLNCDSEQGDLEDVIEGMRLGYSQSLSNYWHERLKKANEDLEQCKKRLSERVQN